MAEWDGNERRQGACPCKYIVELRVQQEGDVKLLKAEQEHVKERHTTEIQSYVDQVRELSLQARECVLSVSRAAEKFTAGAARFEAIEQRVAGVEAWQRSVTDAVGADPGTFIRNWWPVAKRCGWWHFVWATVVTSALVYGGYLQAGAKSLAALIP